MPYAAVATLELSCAGSRGLRRLRRVLPPLLCCLALTALAQGSGAAALGPLGAALLLVRFLRRADPAGTCLHCRHDGWYDAAGSAVSLHQRARFDAFLWLELRDRRGCRHLLLCADAVGERRWRLLRRALTLQQAAGP